jgi:hypothetical protein
LRRRTRRSASRRSRRRPSGERLSRVRTKLHAAC